MSKITTHEFILKIENDSTFLELFRRGLISLTVLNYKVYYERYKSELKRFKKGQAITNVSIEYNISEITVRRAIQFMLN